MRSPFAPSWCSEKSEKQGGHSPSLHRYESPEICAEAVYCPRPAAVEIVAWGDRPSNNGTPLLRCRRLP